MSRGFSLLELSIVMIIVGLMIGGIVAGSSLMHAAELRSLTEDFSRYQTAVHQFQDRHNTLPGDMHNAVYLWGAAAGGSADGRDATCAALTSTTPSIDKKTCNGDGNGKIDGLAGANIYERYRFWQHLANAGMIGGQFTGVQGAGGVYDNDPGINTPEASITGASWSFLWSGDMTGNPNSYDGSYGNTAEIRDDSGTTNPFKFLTSEDAYNIDKKLDDGMPGTGLVRTYKPNVLPECTTSDVAITAEYKLSSAKRECSLIFITGF